MIGNKKFQRLSIVFHFNLNRDFRRFMSDCLVRVLQPLHRGLARDEQNRLIVSQTTALHLSDDINLRRLTFLHQQNIFATPFRAHRRRKVSLARQAILRCARPGS
jgi:hypothetical protein